MICLKMKFMKQFVNNVNKKILRNFVKIVSNTYVKIVRFVYITKEKELNIKFQITII